MSITSKYALKLGLALFLSAISTLAQDQAVDCPSVNLRPPAGLVQPENKATVAIDVSGGRILHTSLSFDWFVSRGRITGGQGKEVVEILTAEEDEGTTVKIVASVRGLPPKCSAVAFGEFGVAPLPIGEPVDKFGKIPRSQTDPYLFESRLDVYIAQLLNSPGYEGLVTIEFNKKDSLQHKMRHIQRMYRHFAFRKLDLKLITFAISEHEYPEKTTLWTMHPKAKVPKYARNYRIIKAENYRNRLNCLFPLD